MSVNKLIHIVGGGAGQLPLVKKAKEVGLSVLVTDMYPDSPCREYADQYYVVDTTDREGTFRVARECGIDAIATDQTDVAVPTVAYVAEKLGLPGITLEVANRFTNKLIMRETCEKVVPESIPQFEYFTRIEEAARYVSVCATPFVLKPIGSQGSKGVFKCDAPDLDKLEISFRESRGMGILVEEFIQGEEVALECFTLDKVTHVLAFSKKQHFSQNDCIDKSVSFFADLDPDVEKSVTELNRKIIQSFGLDTGITHAEYKVHNGKPYLIEIAARGAGSGVSGTIIPKITGFDVNQFILDSALNQKSQDYQGLRQSQYAYLEFMEFAPGKVKSISLKDDIASSAEVINLSIDIGDVIKSVSDSRDRAGLFIVIDQSIERVKEKARALREAVEITYE